MDLKLENIKKGTKLRVKKFNKRPVHWNSDGLMDKYMGQFVTVRDISQCINQIRIEEAPRWHWYPSDFEYVKCIFANTK